MAHDPKDDTDYGGWLYALSEAAALKGSDTIDNACRKAVRRAADKYGWLEEQLKAQSLKLQEEQKAYEQLSAAFAKRATLLQECESRLDRCQKELEFMTTSRDSFRAAYEKQNAGSYHEIRLDQTGELDEIVGVGRFHLEQMDDNYWFLELAECALFIDGKRVGLSPRDGGSWAEVKAASERAVEKPATETDYDAAAREYFEKYGKTGQDALRKWFGG